MKSALKLNSLSLTKTLINDTVYFLCEYNLIGPPGKPRWTVPVIAFQERKTILRMEYLRVPCLAQ